MIKQIKHKTKKATCKCMRKSRKCTKCRNCRKCTMKRRSTKGGSFLGEFIVGFNKGLLKGFHPTRKKNKTSKRRKQSGGAWGLTNAVRGIQYNLVKLGNNFAGKPTPSSANPYPTQGQYAK